MHRDDSSISSLQKQIRYEFKDLNLLIRALTTAGYVDGKKDVRSQAALSTLGDAVLGAIVADRSFHDDSTPCQITNCKRENGTNAFLAELAEELCFELFTHIICSKGELPRLRAYHLDSASCSEEAKGGSTIHANTMEAIIGAIYRDGGYDEAMKVVNSWLNRRTR